MNQFRYILLKILPSASKAAGQYGGGVPKLSGKTEALIVPAVKRLGYSGCKAVTPPGRGRDHTSSEVLISPIKTIVLN